jgi:hypothetical protein
VPVLWTGKQNNATLPFVQTCTAAFSMLTMDDMRDFKVSFGVTEGDVFDLLACYAASVGCFVSFHFSRVRRPKKMDPKRR